MTKKRQPDKVVERAKQCRGKVERTRREEQRRAVKENGGGYPTFSLADLLFGRLKKQRFPSEGK